MSTHLYISDTDKTSKEANDPQGRYVQIENLCDSVVKDIKTTKCKLQLLKIYHDLNKNICTHAQL